MSAHATAALAAKLLPAERSIALARQLRMMASACRRANPARSAHAERVADRLDRRADRIIDRIMGH
jgi:hypothetical protein